MTTTTPGFDFEQAAGRIRELNERIIGSAKEAGETYLTAYENALKTIASAQEQAGAASQIDWLANLATAQANFTREMTEAYVKVARSVLKA